MLKKILITFLIVPVIGGAIYGYFYFKQVKTPLTPVLRAIPSEAVCLVKAKAISETWHSFSQPGSFWPELLSVQAFAEMNSKISFFDSVFSQGSGKLNMEPDAEVYLATYPDSIKGVEFLLAFNIPLTAEKRAVNDLIDAAVPSFLKKKDEVIAGIPVKAYELKDGKGFYYYHSNTIFAFSFSKELIALSAQNLSKKGGLITDKNFVKVLKTASADANTNVFVNFRNLSGVLPQYLNDKNKNFVAAMGEFARWISLDLKMNKNLMSMNGYTFANDSLNDFLSVFRKQKAPEFKIHSILPVNTAFFAYAGISQPIRFVEDLTQFRYSSGRFEKELKQRRLFENRYGTDVRYFFKSWMGNEMVMSVSESLGENYQADSYVIFEAPDTMKFRKALAELKQSIQVNDSTYQDTSSYVYRKYSIEELPVPGLIQMVFGSASGNFETNWITIIDKYVVFAPNTDALQSVINFYLSGRTLDKDPDYLEFAKSISPRCNYFLYSAVARSASLYRQKVTASIGDEIGKQMDVFRKFQAIGLQFSSEKDLFYNSLSLKYNPVYRPQFNTLWEFEADKKLSAAPSELRLNDSTVVFVLQDVANNIYLLNSEGKLQWKKSISEKIMGGIKLLKFEDEHRLVFSSKHYLYSFNMDGDIHENFPVTLPCEATVECGVMKIDKKPLILVACTNLSVYNYSADGRIDETWRTERLKDTLRMPFTSMHCDGRDMVVWADESGYVRVVDKNGNWVVKIKERIPQFVSSKLITEAHKSVNSSAVWVQDADGGLIRFNFKGKYDRYPSPLKKSASTFSYAADMDGDSNPECIFACGKQMLVMRKNGETVFNFTLPDEVNTSPELLKMQDSLVFLSVLTQNNRLYLFNRLGEQNRDIAFQANQMPVPLSIDKDQFHFAVAAFNNKILAYALECKPESYLGKKIKRKSGKLKKPA